MSTVLGCPKLEPAVDSKLSADDLLRRQVWEILAGLVPRAHHPERRGMQRFPYPHLLYLTPVEEDGVSPAGSSIVVVGKHLSERGLGFFYQHPLANRRMIASLEVQPSRYVGFLLDITWCRFTQHGWYDSGGRFLQAVPSPVCGAMPARQLAARASHE
jgi:hypothetical protein